MLILTATQLSSSIIFLSLHDSNICKKVEMNALARKKRKILLCQTEFYPKRMSSMKRSFNLKFYFRVCTFIHPGYCTPPLLVYTLIHRFPSQRKTRKCSDMIHHGFIFYIKETCHLEGCIEFSHLLYINKRPRFKNIGISLYVLICSRVASLSENTRPINLSCFIHSLGSAEQCSSY